MFCFRRRGTPFYSSPTRPDQFSEGRTYSGGNRQKPGAWHTQRLWSDDPLCEKIEALRSKDGCIVKKRASTPQSENTQKNINLLCSLPDPEHGKTRFTPHQIELINYLKEGWAPMEIAAKWGTGVRNVYNQILTCATKILSCGDKTDPPASRKPRKGRYQQFADADLSVLGKRAREILKTRIAHPELSLQQIADMHGISYSTCAGTLSAAARRLQSMLPS